MSNQISAQQSITVRQGTTFKYTFTMTNSGDGSAIPITGSKFKLNVKKSVTTPQALLSLTSSSPLSDPAGSHPYDSSLAPLVSTIGVSDGAAGKWVLSLTAYRTAAEQMPAGQYQYEVDRISPDGTVDTIMAGLWTVEPDLG